MILFAAENYQYPLRIAEIGVLWGTNARRMFDRLNVEEMYLIDPYEKYSDYNWQEVVFLPSSFNSAMTRLEQHWDKCIPLQMTSEEAASIIPNDLDMVYIDGNHAYEFVKKDIELYAPKIKPGGLIGGHDIEGSPMTAGVQQAVFEYADKHNLDVHVDKPDWWITL
jgi:predicted O-methyltransferase YrrM